MKNLNWFSPDLKAHLASRILGSHVRQLLDYINKKSAIYFTQERA